jgi:putative membrane protein
MKHIPLIIGLLGLGFAAWLVANEGPHIIIKTFLAAGWGTLVVCLLHFPHMAVAGYGWQLLWPKQRRPSFILFMWVLWVREAVNTLLPVARIGGEIASVRVMTKAGMPTASAIGSLVVETTLSVATTFAFVMMGLFVFSWRVPEHGLFLQWALGLLISIIALAGFFALQRYGGFKLVAQIVKWMAKDKFASDHFSGLRQSSAKLDRAVLAFYGRPWRVAQCTFWSFAGWWVGAFELYIALLFLGHDASFSDGIILEAMIMATGSAAFFVPGAIGVQEGTLLVFGRMLGISDEICLALALMRRARDVLVMVPGLLLWQLQENKKAVIHFLGRLPFMNQQDNP